MGRKIAETTKSLEETITMDHFNIHVATREVYLPFNTSFTLDKEKEVKEFKNSSSKLELDAPIEGFIRYLDIVEERLKRDTCPGREANITGVKIGDLSFIALPCEIYTSTGLMIKKRFPQTIVSAYTNGDIGYIPPRAEFESFGSYGAGRAQLIYNPFPFTSGVEQLLVNGVFDVLNDLEHRS